MSKNRVYGIDLGTTYSCIACVDEHGKPIIINNAEGEATTPSVVYFESPDSIVVGQAAKEVVSIYADQCVSTVKRAMGNPDWECTFFDQSYKPQEISSFILRKLVSDAEQITGDSIKDVVITCPAYFGINEKEATKQAGEIAGLNVLYVIPEPTAAALAYGIEQDQDQVILVYDLGGGTFDVTMIEVKTGEINVICTGGDHELGGKDWDDAVVSYFADRFAEETGTPADALLEDQETYQELLNAAERCKKSLSSRQSVVEAVRFEGERARVELTREKLDEITSEYLERTISLTEQEIERARDKGYEKIDKLLLVGGSTYMPQVIETVTQRFPQLEVRQFDPNQAVAKGAAVFGFKCHLDEQIRIRVADQTGQDKEDIDLDKVDEEVKEAATSGVAEEYGFTLPGIKELVDKRITNVTSKSFGIVVMSSDDREVVANLINVDDKVPVEITQTFGTYEDDQIQADLRCMENQLRDQQQVEVDDCKEIGTSVLAFGQALPKGSKIEITFALGPDGLLQLKGRDLTKGNEVEARFETESIMTTEEVEEAKSRNLTTQVS